MQDVVIPYKVTRTHRRLGLFPTETSWEANLLLSDVHFADSSEESLHRTYSRNALLVVLKDSAPFDPSKDLKWEQIKIDVPDGEVAAKR